MSCFTCGDCYHWEEGICSANRHADVRPEKRDEFADVCEFFSERAEFTSKKPLCSKCNDTLYLKNETGGCVECICSRWYE